MNNARFQEEVIDRLARMEVKQDIIMTTVNSHSDTLVDHGKSIVEVDARAKSAHHRIDGIFMTAGIVGAVAGWVVEFVSKIWSAKGTG